MAEFEARWDPTTNDVFVYPTDGYGFEDHLFQTLKAEPYAGRYAPQYPGELRFSRTAGVEAVAYLRALGHKVSPVEGTRHRVKRDHAPRGPLECVVCATGYPIDWVPGPAELCRNPDTVIDAETGARVSEYPPHELALTPPPQ